MVKPIYDNGVVKSLKPKYLYGSFCDLHFSLKIVVSEEEIRENREEKWLLMQSLFLYVVFKPFAFLFVNEEDGIFNSMQGEL